MLYVCAVLGDTTLHATPGRPAQTFIKIHVTSGESCNIAYPGLQSTFYCFRWHLWSNTRSLVTLCQSVPHPLQILKTYLHYSQISFYVLPWFESLYTYTDVALTVSSNSCMMWFLYLLWTLKGLQSYSEAKLCSFKRLLILISPTYIWNNI